MAVPSNTYQTFQTVGIKEDLSDVIYKITPEETPFMSNAGRDTASQSLYEWQTDALDAVDTANAQVEGDDATAQAATPTVRLANYAQISRKVVQVSGTNEVVDKAGRKSEMAYQLAKRSAELKRDMEAIALANQAAVSGSATVARKTAAFITWLKTNTSKGTSGVDPVYATTPTGAGGVRTDGTARAFTEVLLKAGVLAAYTAGGRPKVLSVAPANKQVASTFSGIATKTQNVSNTGQASIVGAADVYVSDFGNLSVVPNRFQRSRDALLIDFAHVKFVFLRKFKTENLAKTGDSEKKMLLVEWGLKVTHEAAHGIITDLS